MKQLYESVVILNKLFAACDSQIGGKIQSNTECKQFTFTVPLIVRQNMFTVKYLTVISTMKWPTQHTSDKFFFMEMKLQTNEKTINKFRQNYAFRVKILKQNWFEILKKNSHERIRLNSKCTRTNVKAVSR